MIIEQHLRLSENFRAIFLKYFLLTYNPFFLVEDYKMDLEDYNLIKNNSKNLEKYDFDEIIKKYNFINTIFIIKLINIKIIN